VAKAEHCSLTIHFVERAEILREKGTEPQPLLSREVDKYTWRDVGSSYLPSDGLAAFVFAQLEVTSASSRGGATSGGITKRDCAAGRSVRRRLPVVPANRPSLHLFYLLMHHRGAK